MSQHTTPATLTQTINENLPCTCTEQGVSHVVIRGLMLRATEEACDCSGSPRVTPSSFHILLEQSQHDWPEVHMGWFLRLLLPEPHHRSTHCGGGQTPAVTHSLEHTQVPKITYVSVFHQRPHPSEVLETMTSASFQHQCLGLAHLKIILGMSTHTHSRWTRTYFPGGILQWVYKALEGS